MKPASDEMRILRLLEGGPRTGLELHKADPGLLKRHKVYITLNFMCKRGWVQAEKQTNILGQTTLIRFALTDVGRSLIASCN